MHRLLSIFILTLTGLVLGAAALSAAKARPTIYLFGERHQTVEAVAQKDRLLSYASRSEVLVARECFGFDKDAFHRRESPLVDLNTIGSEDPLHYATHAILLAFSFYHEIQKDPDLEDNLQTIAERYLGNALATITLNAPEWDPFFNKFANQEDPEYDFFKQLNDLRNRLNSMQFSHSDSRFLARLKMRTEMKEQFLCEYGSIGAKVDFMRLFAESILAHLATTQPNEFLPFIYSCMNAVAASNIFDSECEYAYARNYPIASNLAYMQPFAAERGLLLAGIYGNLHIPGLKALLEERGFEVIVNDMAALETAIENNHRKIKEEL